MKLKDAAEILEKYPELAELELPAIDRYIDGIYCIGHLSKPANISMMFARNYWNKLNLIYDFSANKYIIVEISENNNEIWFELYKEQE